jgi:hypothetical protein
MSVHDRRDERLVTAIPGMKETCTEYVVTNAEMCMPAPMNVKKAVESPQ